MWPSTLYIEGKATADEFAQHAVPEEPDRTSGVLHPVVQGASSTKPEVSQDPHDKTNSIKHAKLTKQSASDHFSRFISFWL